VTAAQRKVAKNRTNRYSERNARSQAGAAFFMPGKLYLFLLERKEKSGQPPAYLFL
jgi:hypothetical protein